MEAKHTPGQHWRAGSMGRSEVFILRGTTLIARVPMPLCAETDIADESKRAETEANARLIAAAPQLLEIVRGFADKLPDGECSCGNEIGSHEPDCPVLMVRPLLDSLGF